MLCTWNIALKKQHEKQNKITSDSSSKLHPLTEIINVITFPQLFQFSTTRLLLGFSYQEVELSKQWQSSEFAKVCHANSIACSQRGEKLEE